MVMGAAPGAHPASMSVEAMMVDAVERIINVFMWKLLLHVKAGNPNRLPAVDLPP
jgi:hypothetical protein